MIHNVTKRNGDVVPFSPQKIADAIDRCYSAAGLVAPQQAASMVVAWLEGRHDKPSVEQVQNAVETVLLELGERDAAKRYMAYRDGRAKHRGDAIETQIDEETPPPGWGIFAHRVYMARYSMGKKERWEDTAKRVATAVFSPHADKSGVEFLREEMARLISERKVMPGGRYLYSAGRELHQCQNCLMTMVEDSREGWAEHVHNHTMGLSTGAGMGTVYSKLRPKGAKLKRTGGVASGPIPLAVATNELGRGLRQGGDRRSALWGGLHWWHADARPFVDLKNWSPEVRAMKAANWEFPAPMDGTNISICLDDEFFAAYNDPNYSRQDEMHGKVDHARAHDLYWSTIKNALETGDPGFSIDVGKNAGEWLRNACTELCATDDSDICNIASINLARIDTFEEFILAVNVTTAFLLSGTVYSHVPYDKVAKTRERFRRLGLGLMGVHEWLLKRKLPYGPNDELGKWLAEYAKSTNIAAQYADSWGISRPVKTRAMAPNGTIGIVAETTTCMEPLLCVAYKRRVKQGDQTLAQYVIDPVAQRLVSEGVDPNDIETAYSLAETREGIERRVAFQAWFQQFVDHGIASTINLPSWGGTVNNADNVQWFGEMLLKYLPNLRGITMYPDGARGGQPITQVPYAEAVSRGTGLSYESGDVCDLRGGSCGS